MNTTWQYSPAVDSSTSSSYAETIIVRDASRGDSSTHSHTARRLCRHVIALSIATAIFSSSFMEYRSGSETACPMGLWEPAVQTSSTAMNASWFVELAPANNAAQALVTQVRRLLEDGQRTRAIDAVYDTIDDLLLDKSFDEARFVIRAISREDFPLPILLSALTISLPWREVLSDVRAELANVIRQRALKDGGESKATAVLTGLV